MRIRTSPGATYLRLEVNFGIGRFHSALSDAKSGRTIATAEGALSPEELEAFEFPLGADPALRMGEILFAAGVGEAIRVRLDAGQVILVLSFADESPPIPWEFAQVASLFGRAIVLHPRLSIVRDGGSGELGQRLRAHNHVLIVTADPGSPRFPSLPFAEAELESIRTALSATECRHWTVEVLRYATPDGVRRALNERRPAVVHFIGHGDVLGTGGALAFESGRHGVVQLVYVDDLVGPLRAAGTQLVVLSACQSAGRVNSYGAQLASAGVPAVVGMQRSISDDACQLFARAIYAALAEGAPIDQAMRQGRAAIRGTDLDWGGPVLILNTSVFGEAWAVEPEPPDAAILSHASTIGKLPAPLTSFVGRDDQLANLARILRESRLVSLVGLGGIGKTRLAIEAAARSGGKFLHGVRFVDLQNVEDPTNVIPSIAWALGFKESAGHTLLGAIQSGLASKQLLLLVDNCEHVREAAAQSIRAILESAPDVRILTTGRAPLGLRGERVVRVSPLEVPAGFDVATAKETDAVRLFVERALYVNPGFRITAPNVRLLCRLTRMLDGIPLALELAAARMGVMSLERLVNRLDHTLADLKSSEPEESARHHTLLATMDWSHGLLDRNEQTLFARLGAFGGTWSLESCEELAGYPPLEVSQVFDLLAGLVNNSLVVAEESEQGMRYRFLETVRAYARAKLRQSDDEDTARTRLFDCMVGIASRIQAGILGHDQLECRRLFDLEIDNICSALEWGIGYVKRIDEVVSLLTSLQGAWIMAGELSVARTYLERIKPLLPENAVAAQSRVRAMLGKLRVRAGDIGGIEMLREAVRISEGADRKTHMKCVSDLATILFEQANFDEAEQLFNLDLELRGGAKAISQDHVRLNFGALATERGQFELAETHFRLMLDEKRSAGDVRGAGLALCYLAHAQAAQGRPEARSLYREAIACLARVPDYYALAANLAAASSILALEHPRAAAKIQGFADQLADRTGASFDPHTLALAESAKSAATASLDPSLYEEMYEKGRWLDIGEVLDLMGINPGATRR